MDILFNSTPSSHTNALVVGVFADNELSQAARDIDLQIHGNLMHAINASHFKGKPTDMLVITAPHGIDVDRIVVVGLGDKQKINELQLTNLGGQIYATLATTPDRAAEIILHDLVLPSMKSEEIAAHVGVGALLRSWRFDKYCTKKEDEKKPQLQQITFVTASPDDAQEKFDDLSAVVAGSFFMRDLASEPPNILYPESFAARVKELKSYGLKIEILTEKKMESLGMGALLGVAQGSIFSPRLVSIQWQGGEKGQKPVAFVGKGVTFDSGGISLKPSASMDEMKYDMCGAAVVAGLMQTLAKRKAKVNAVGVIGLVENMPSGTAQRPGDIVTSMSGQTIEILNTDAEGRLVLADALSYTQKEFDPKLIVNLATLTGAIIVSLGDEYAGLFSNNDELSQKLTDTGEKVGEKLWRFPLHKKYDKMLDTPVADMANITRKRGAGSITAAQFLQRFIENDLPWAHLDIAGVSWADKASPLAGKGATAFGVRLLDRMVKDYYEA